MTSQMHLLDDNIFIERMPGRGPTDEERAQFVTQNLEEAEVKSDIYFEMAKTSTSVLGAANCTTLRFNITPNHKAEDVSCLDTCNNGGIYLNHPQARKATTRSPVARIRNQLPPKILNAPELGCHSWDYLTVPVQAKYEFSKAAFFFNEGDTLQESDDEDTVDNTDTSVEGPDQEAKTGDPSSLPSSQNVPPSIIRNTRQGLKAFAQFNDYMQNTLTYQHRNFSYAIYIAKNMCRLLFLDRSGAYITTPFDWTVTTSSLHTFLWKLAHMSEAQMGYDATASLASSTECDMFKAMAYDASVPKEVREYVKRATSDSAPIYKVRVTSKPGTDTDKLPTAEDDQHGPIDEQDFLVGRHHFAADSLVGRCTRGYVALRLQDGKADSLCFLKDCWRSYVPGRTRPEHLVYERLAKHNVPHVATLICGGDVVDNLGPQTTVVQESIIVDNMKPVPRIHYRLVTKEICVPVQEFRTFKELSVIFIDVLTAHFYAYDQAGVLHRDISVGNIMIDPASRRGLLIDWDLSRLVEQLGSGPVGPARSGTWSTRSALLLKYPRKPYRLSDDLESIVHAYRSLVLRYHRTNVTPKLQSFVKTTYEEIIEVNGVLIGGFTKLDQFASPRSPFQVIQDPHLQSILDALAEGCFSFYDQINLGRMQEKYGIQNEPARPKRDKSPPIPVSIEMPPDIRELLARRARQRAASAKPPTGPQSKDGSSTPCRPTDRDRDAPQAEPDDPCDVDGFLSFHADLVEVFYLYDKYPNLANKGGDYFRVERPPPLSVFWHAESSSSQSSDLVSVSLSESTEPSDQSPALALVIPARPFGRPPLPKSSLVLAGRSPVANSQLGKRAREDASEDVSADTSAKLPEDEPASKRRA
ncbi:hypothetical protein C8Q74DRAFT_588073 [Fomes fomentarius]|nr:hypothetical protein C8Q74DRAFT_588073 [Fomes fomentarius]